MSFRNKLPLWQRIIFFPFIFLLTVILVMAAAISSMIPHLFWLLVLLPIVVGLGILALEWSGEQWMAIGVTVFIGVYGTVLYVLRSKIQRVKRWLIDNVVLPDYNPFVWFGYVDEEKVMAAKTTGDDQDVLRLRRWAAGLTILVGLMFLVISMLLEEWFGINLGQILENFYNVIKIT